MLKIIFNLIALTLLVAPLTRCQAGEMSGGSQECNDPACPNPDLSLRDAFQSISKLAGTGIKGYGEAGFYKSFSGNENFSTHITIEDQAPPLKVKLLRNLTPIAECDLVYTLSGEDFIGKYYSASAIVSNNPENNLGACDIDLVAPGVQSGKVNLALGDIAVFSALQRGKFVPFYVVELYSLRTILDNQSVTFPEPNPLWNLPSANLKAAIEFIKTGNATSQIKAAKRSVAKKSKAKKQRSKSRRR